MTRGAETQNDQADKFFLNIDKYPSRKIIASGGTEPVDAAGSGGHSVFAYYLIKSLRDNTNPYITSFQLFDQLVRGVTNNSKQTPEYGTVPDTGDQGSSDFTFILRKLDGCPPARRPGTKLGRKKNSGAAVLMEDGGVDLFISGIADSLQ